MKKSLIGVLFLAGIILFFGMVYAQENEVGSPSPSASPSAIDVKESAEKIRETAGKLKELQEEKNAEFLALEWQKFLLGISFFNRLDQFFMKDKFIFNWIFALDYSFSLSVLFSVLIWIFTFIALPSYFIFLEGNAYKWFAGLAGTIILAHLQLFNYLGALGSRLVFYGHSAIWTSLTSFVVLIFIVMYYLFNLAIASRLKKAKKEGKLNELEHEVKEEKEFRKGIVSAS
ncbi:MAG: hypothetical protein Q7S27_03330 [Nanoarchaeota archaeon]|nr:hypothetical protein [Nanoarchaeota archaeon]